MSETEGDSPLPKTWIDHVILGLLAFVGITVSIIYASMNTGIEENRAEIKQVRTQITELEISTQKGFQDIVITMKDNNAALLKNMNDFQKKTIATTVKNQSDIEYLKDTASQ